MRPARIAWFTRLPWMVYLHGGVQSPGTCMGRKRLGFIWDKILPSHYKVPMDRFIIGQAIVEDMTSVTVARARAKAKQSSARNQPIPSRRDEFDLIAPPTLWSPMS